jgi:hypothetical protein
MTLNIGGGASREAPWEKNTCKAFWVISIEITNDLKTASLELTHPIHVSLPPALHFHFHLNLCYYACIVIYIQKF